MNPLSIFAASFLIALSGAMMPGPMLTVTIRESARQGFRAGPLVVAGHALLELALVAALLAGVGAAVQNRWFLGSVGVVGGVVLVGMAAGMVRGLGGLTLALHVDAAGPGGSGRSAVAGGVATSLASPYFTLWWATAGLSSLALAAGAGWRGPASFFLGHFLADLLWYSLVAAGVHFGRRFLSDRLYRGLVGACAVALLAFGSGFVLWGAGKLAS